MKKTISTLLLVGTFVTILHTQPALTIYNQNFAVVRDTVPLDLQAGPNIVRYADATAKVEPDSVILRDPAGDHSLQILEQNYRNDPISEPLLLSLFEGKTIDFEKDELVNNSTSHTIISGKIIRSGYVPDGEPQSPIIEVDGKLQFSLPGQPLFPDLGDDTVLKPAFNWVLQSDKPGRFNAEVGYVTGGFNWSASYNLVSPEKGDFVNLVGWITMENQSGKTFENARIKLMAGDVNKIQPMRTWGMTRGYGGIGGGGGEGGPPVTEKSFDEFHLYDIARPTTLHDRETKQVEFVQAGKVYAPTIYVYDGAFNDNASSYRFAGNMAGNQNFGARENTKKVLVQREFVNDETNQLGIALPAGKLRFYRRDDDGQLQFVGENTIDHTPRKETIRVTTGNAFDLVGERKQTNFKINFDPANSGPDPGINDPFHGLPVPIDPATGLPFAAGHATATTNAVSAPWIDESFEIKLRNRKKEPVEICVVEHLYRGDNWEITAKSDDFVKKDSQTIEFRIPVQPDVERTVTYTVHYSW